MRENIETRAVKILTERRLTVERVANGLIVASCRGDTDETYRLGYDPVRDQWRCTCEASATFHKTCKHLRALQHVVTKPKGV